MSSRREYLQKMRQRYLKAKKRSERSALIDEVVSVLGYHRKYAIRVLNKDVHKQSQARKRTRKRKYAASMLAIVKVWEALDCICAERLHPVLLQMAELLEKHGELVLTEENREHLANISRATLARMLKDAKSTERLPRKRLKPKAASGLKAQVPVDHYSYKETRPGALEVDLVAHNGGSVLGHFAYTLSVVDVVTGISQRRAILGKGQRGVFKALRRVIREWPYPIWALHTDNGSEFLNDHLVRFCQANNIRFTRSRPYKKNDSPYVEQKNFQHVRALVGYERYDTPHHVAWLNSIYSLYDLYVNLYQPSRKLIHKERHGGRVRKYYDKAKTPFQRACDIGAISESDKEALLRTYYEINPVELKRQIQSLLIAGPDKFAEKLPLLQTTPAD